MNWKRFTTLFISLIVLVPFEQWLHACGGGDGDPYDYYPSFFQPSVTKSPAYTPFFYTSLLKYYDEWYDFEAKDALPDANIAEWKSFTGGVREADLDSFIYSFSRIELINLYNYIDAGKPLQISPPVLRNGMTAWFIQKKDKEALGYLMFAKQCEPLVAGNNGWEAPQRDTAKMMKLVKNGLQLHAAAQQDFFKWRYAFQVLRLCLYANNPKQTLALYETLIADKTDAGIMYPRCLGLKAGAYFRQHQVNRAAYLYSRVFDLSDEMKRSAFLSYDWSVGAESADVLRLCATGHEKAVVHVMDGLHEYEYALPKMQAAYEADPAVKGLDVLMVREINKIEARYQSDVLVQERNLNGYSWWYDRYNGEYYESDKKAEAATKYNRYMEVLKTFSRKLATEGKAPRKPFWLLSSAYISFMQKATAECRDYLQKAKAAGMNDREAALHDLITALIVVRGSARMTPAVEAEILPTLQALGKRALSSPEAAKVYRDLTGTVLATAYLRDGDTTKAIFLLAQSNIRTESGYYADNDFLDLPGSLLEHVSIGKIADVRDFYNKKNKTPYERWLTDESPYTPAVLTELEGTRYLRLHDWRAAVASFSKVPQDLLDRHIATDPFRAGITDFMDADREDSARLYDRYTFSKRMLELSSAIAKNARAEDLFAYATGLYSTSYYGKSHNLYTYYRSSTDDLGYYESTDRSKLPKDAQEYYSLRKAEEYFTRAAAAATDRELKARALWMAGKCWQKRAQENFGGEPSEVNGSEYDDYFRYSLASPYFKELRTNFQDTRFYSEAVTGCEYFHEYARRK